MCNSETPSPTGRTSPGLPQRQSSDSDVDARPRLPVPKPAEPAGVVISLTNLDQHYHSVSQEIRQGNRSTLNIVRRLCPANQPSVNLGSDSNRLTHPSNRGHSARIRRSPVASATSGPCNRFMYRGINALDPLARSRHSIVVDVFRRLEVITNLSETLQACIVDAR